MLNDNQLTAQNHQAHYYKHAWRAVLFSVLGCFVFFCPIKSFGGNVPFGIIVNTLAETLGNAWLYFLGLLMTVNVVGFVWGKFWAVPKTWLYEYYKNDSLVQGVIYTVGALFTSMVLFESGWGAVIAEGTGTLVIRSVVRYTAWILPVGGACVPLLLDFGVLEFVGTLLEPLMRPLYRLPGRAALNAIASFVSSSSIAVYITTRIYKQRGYTQKELCCVATGFSAVSVGFAALAAQTLGMMNQFTQVFFSSLLITFLISIIMVRIPPLSRKRNVYVDGHEQTPVDITSEIAGQGGLLKRAVDRAVVVASQHPSFLKSILMGLKDGVLLMPKVIPFLAALGISGLMVAEYTNFFNLIGAPLVPLYEWLHIPDAVVVAKTTFVGIAEMLLPVLVAAKYAISEAARFFVLNMALVQIVFFSEPATIMLAMGVPCTWWELVIIFFERTLIAIPLIAVLMHVLY